MKGKTLPQLFMEKAANEGNKVALRQKSYGIWNEITWSAYLEQVRSFSLGLSKELDFQKGDVLAIIGDNRPQWLYAQMAAQSLGGIPVGIYQESLPEQLLNYLNHSEARIVVAEDQEQVDKLIAIEDRLQYVEKIIFYNDKGMRKYEHPKLIYFEDLQAAGKKYGEIEKDFFRSQIERLVDTDIALLSYTQGTHGDPKGVLLTHANLVSSVTSLLEVDKAEERDDYLSFLPLAWIGEQMMSACMPLCSGVVINFPEEPSTVLIDLREIGPHTLIAPPKTYENIISRFQVRIGDSSWFKKKLYYYFKGIADKVTDARQANQQLSFGTKVMHALGDFLMFSAIRDHLGLARIKRAYVHGASLGPDALRFFHSIGVNVKQSYGATELSGIALMHRDHEINPDSVGVPLPGTKVKLSEFGEVLIKSPGIFAGYYKESNNPLIDGWFPLGDGGALDSNDHLHVYGKVDEVLSLAEGEYSLKAVENKLKVSPFIKESVVYGKDKPYLVALINIDLANVGRWAEKNQHVYTTYADLAMKPEVIGLIEKEVKRLMEDLPEEIQIKKFVILHKELDADDEELTRIQVVRKQYAIRKFQCLIDGMYSSESQLRYEEKKADDHESIKEMLLQVIDLAFKKEVA